MASPHHLKRLRARARALDERPHQGVPPEPFEAVAAELAVLARATAPAGLVLIAVALWAATSQRDPRVALLGGVPGSMLLVLGTLARRRRVRRVASVLATSTAGMLALAGAPALGPAAAGGTGALYQAACCLLACAYLGLAWPAWRRANAAGDAARARRALYDEL